MLKTTVKENTRALLALARQLAITPGLTWVDASNAIYAPGGPFSQLFPTRADRVAYGKTKESAQIDELIHSLPEPPVNPNREHIDGKFMLPIPKQKRRRASHADNGKRSQPARRRKATGPAR